MNDLILHHYDFSNFAEKARLMLGFKRLAWLSVEQPPILPKPNLTPLTGGYRRIPVLQDGADLWCDTRLIARELERRAPSPTLFPERTRGFADAIAKDVEEEEEEELTQEEYEAAMTEDLFDYIDEEEDDEDRVARGGRRKDKDEE